MLYRGVYYVLHEINWLRPRSPHSRPSSTSMLSGGRPEVVAQAQAGLDAAQQKLALLQKGATDDVMATARSPSSRPWTAWCCPCPPHPVPWSLVSRGEDPRDRRATRVVPTETARTLVERLYAYRRTEFRRLLEYASTDTLEALANGLQGLAQAAREAATESGPDPGAVAQP
jgi:hypothetical protein